LIGGEILGRFIEIKHVESNAMAAIYEFLGDHEP